MNIFLQPKGRITSRFANNEEYRTFSHTGIDFQDGFRKPQYAIADGYAYKVINKDNPDPQQYRNIYAICETPLGAMEVAYVHCWDILVDEGDHVVKAQHIYTEGNTGDLVFSAGTKVEPHEKWSGKGSHSHISVRPVRRVTTRKSGQHYLRKSNGAYYRDNNRFYYEIAHPDNGAKGWVDWSVWMYTEPLAVSIVKSIISLTEKLIAQWR